MPDTAAALAQEFTAYASDRMAKSLGEIERCCAQLSEEQMRHRGGDHENAIVNLLLHLSGNIRQWILHGVAGEPDVRTRDAEFSLSAEASAEAALAKLRETIASAQAAIAKVTPERLLEITNPQPTGITPPCTVLAAIAKVFGHLEHHTGQIIVLTKQALARDLDLSLPRKR